MADGEAKEPFAPPHCGCESKLMPNHHVTYRSRCRSQQYMIAALLGSTMALMEVVDGESLGCFWSCLARFLPEGQS